MKVCQHFHYRLIDNVTLMYRWLFVREESKNGSFKFEVGPQQFNLKMQHFSKFHLNGDPGLAKWLIMSGYMDQRRPRVCRRSNVGLVKTYTHYFEDITWSSVVIVPYSSIFLPWIQFKSYSLLVREPWIIHTPQTCSRTTTLAAETATFYWIQIYILKSHHQLESK